MIFIRQISYNDQFKSWIQKTECIAKQCIVLRPTGRLVDAGREENRPLIFFYEPTEITLNF